jgi:hypothetical protein
VDFLLAMNIPIREGMRVVFQPVQPGESERSGAGHHESEFRKDFWDVHRSENSAVRLEVPVLSAADSLAPG